MNDYCEANNLKRDQYFCWQSTARKKVDLNIRECSKIKCVEKEISLLCYVKVSYNTVNKFTISRRIIILWNFKQIFFKE